MLGVVLPAELVTAVARRDGKRPDVVLAAALQGRHEVGQGVKHVLPLPLPLLPQRVHAAEFGRPRIVGEQHDVVAD